MSHANDVDARRSQEVLLSQNGDGRDEREVGMTTKADGNARDDSADLSVDDEALERYHRRRIREINRDERRMEERSSPSRRSYGPRMETSREVG